jgi:hypothetical protein
MDLKEPRINQKKLVNNINKLHWNYSSERKVPEILKGKRFISAFLTKKYFLLSVLSEENLKKVEIFKKEGNHPFPGLIAPDTPCVKSAFNVDNSKYSIFYNTKVLNSFSFNLGKNSTIILNNHEVSLNSKNLGKYNYTIDLMYIISFNSEININNFYNYLDELIEFSFSYWGLQDA